MTLALPIAIAALAFAILFHAVTRKDPIMAVFTELTQPLADLKAAVDSLPGKVAAAVSGGDATAAQDKADTIAAVTTAASEAVAAINAIGAPQP